MSYRAIIVDDEEMARSRLKRLLTDTCGDIEILAEISDGLSAKTEIDKLKPDLVFLDIEMSGMSGIQVALSTNHKPFIIFITAYNQYAVEAFKAMAVDYLLKPVDEKELLAAIGKFKKLSSPPDISKLMSFLSNQVKSKESQRFHVQVGDSIKLIPYDQIVCFEADQKYTTVYATNPSNTYITEKSLAELELTLPADVFLRIHRKHIVNKNYIEEVQRWFDRKLKVVLKIPFDKELVISRGYADKVEQI